MAHLQRGDCLLHQCLRRIRTLAAGRRLGTVHKSVCLFVPVERRGISAERVWDPQTFRAVLREESLQG